MMLRARRAVLALCGCFLIAGAVARAAETPVRPALPAKTIAMLSVSGWDQAIPAGLDWLRAALVNTPAAGEIPDVAQLRGQLRENLPLIDLLPPDAPFAVLMDNFEIGVEPVFAFVAKAGDLTALAEKGNAGGFSLEAPKREGAPWNFRLEAPRTRLMLVPLADGWVVATQKLADARRLGRALKDWTPPAAQHPVELVIDLSKMVELHRDTLNGGIEAMTAMMRIGLAQFKEQVERLEAEVDENEDVDEDVIAQAEKMRAQYDAAQRGVVVLGNRGRELAAALATAGQLRYGIRVEEGVVRLFGDWWPKADTVFARVIADLSKAPAAPLDVIANLPARFPAVAAMGNGEGVDVAEFNGFFAGFLGDLLYVLDGDRDAADQVARLMLDVAAATSGETVAALLAPADTGGLAYGVLARRGEKAGLSRERDAALQEFFFSRFQAGVNALAPDGVSLEFTGYDEGGFTKAMPEKALDRTVEVTRMQSKITGPDFPVMTDEQVDWLQQYTQVAQPTAAVEGWFLTGIGSEWLAGLTAFGKELTSGAEGFGTRDGFAAARAAAGERPSLFVAFAPADTSKAVIPLLHGIIHGGGVRPTPEAIAAAAGLPGGSAVVTLAETFHADRIALEARIPARAVSELVSLIMAVQNEPGLDFAPARVQAMRPAPSAEPEMEDFF